MEQGEGPQCSKWTVGFMIPSMSDMGNIVFIGLVRQYEHVGFDFAPIKT